MAVEVKSSEFPTYVRVEYEEFDPIAFFDDILPFVRTPHRCYHLEEERENILALNILIGVTHPVEFKVRGEKKAIKELEEKLRVNGFRKAKWQWK